MATVTTTITPDQEYFPFEGMPDSQRERSAIPMREVRLFKNGDTIPLTGAGDNQSVYFTSSLDRGYAYALVDIFISINCAVGATNNWDDVAIGYFADATTGSNRTKQIQFPLKTPGVASQEDAQFQCYYPPKIPQLIMIPAIPSELPILTVGTYNATANDVVATTQFFARFLQYSISQAHHFALSTPLPVRP